MWHSEALTCILYIVPCNVCQCCEFRTTNSCWGIFFLGRMTCQPCPPGTHVKPPCTDTNPSCSPCRPGRYNSEWTRAYDCRPCTSHCHGYDEIPKKRCNRFQDLRCGCPSGSWHYKPSTQASKCLSFRVCGRGFGVSIPGTNVSDVTCGECIKAQTFSDVESSYAECKPCTRCRDLGWEEIKACTTASDAACSIITTKSTNQDNGVSVNPASSHPTHISTQMSPDSNTVILSTAAVVLVVISLIGVFVYKKGWCKIGRQSGSLTRKRDSKEGEHGSTEPLNPDSSPLVVAKYTKASSDQRNMRRRSFSSLMLATDKMGLDKGQRSPPILETESTVLLFPPRGKRKDVGLVDIFIWVSSNLGSVGFESFLLALPSENKENRLNNVDIQAIEYKHRENLQDAIREGLEQWREKNEDKTDDKVLADIFQALFETSKHDLAGELCERFAIKH